MTEKIQLSGLCINCFNAEKCSYQMNHTKPIIFCEEFACTEPTELKNNLNKAPKKNDYPINSNLKGVCNNCENIETCHLQKTDCTVITCEEYR